MASEMNYWLRRGLSRRTALRSGALSAGAAAFLAACGSDDKGNSGSSGSGSGTGSTSGPGAGGLLATATAQAAITKQPKPGGSFSFQISAPPPTLDPYTQTSFLNSYVNGLTYSRLLRYRAGVPE